MELAAGRPTTPQVHPHVSREHPRVSEDLEHVLSNGTHLVAMLPSTAEGVVAVQLRRGGRVVDEVRLPYPRAGLAGGRWIISPLERFAVLSVYSGQSEEGYELFRLGDGITRTTGLSYQFGEAASFCFSADEAVLVMALPFACVEWWVPWEDGEVERDAGRLAFPFGQLRVHDIPTGNISVHDLRVSVPEDWQPSRGDYDPDLNPRVINEHHLALSMPWGEVELPLPLPKTITLLVES